MVRRRHATPKHLRWASQIMSKLDYITVRGFKSLADIEQLKLNGVNVLIGANGSGKSNFVEAFSFLRAIRQASLRRYVAEAGGANQLLHFGAGQTREISLSISFEEESNKYDVTLLATDNDELRPLSESAYSWDKAKYPERPFEVGLSPNGAEAGIGNEHRAGVVRYVQEHLDSWLKYQFDDTSRRSPIRLTSNVNDNRFLRTDGSNLASFLYRLGQTSPDSMDIIERTIRLVAPFFDSFVLEPDAINNDRIRLQWRHRGSDAYFDASTLSDGTLRFMALSTLLLQPAELRPSVILLDEPELGLHPYAITILSSVIKSVSVDTQVLLATQSSMLLDQFEPEDVLVADRVGGGTRLRRVELERLESWLGRYSLGQLWEKNEFGGRPAPERHDAT